MSVNDPERFKKTTDVVLAADHGISSLEQFQNHVEKIEEIEILRRCGLDDDDIESYQQYECGELVAHKNMESTVLNNKLHYIYEKIKNSGKEHSNISTESVKNDHKYEETTKEIEANTDVHQEHPMTKIKELENDMFGHMSFDKIESLTKRRKLLRRMKRKEDNRLLEDKFLFEAGHSETSITSSKTSASSGIKNSLWDIKDISKLRNNILPPINTTKNYNREKTENKKIIGPKLQTSYTVKNNKIVRLEPMIRSDDKSHIQEYRAVEIKMPINKGEKRLLEGSQLGVDDIKNMPKFKDYKRGLPTKVLFIKNISPNVCEEDVRSLLKVFEAENGEAINVRILSGRMRGQAFVHFTSEAVCSKALEATNGVILKGKPIIVQFGKSAVAK